MVLRVSGPVPPDAVVGVPVRLGVPRAGRVVLTAPAAAAAVRGDGGAITAGWVTVEVEEVRGPRPPIGNLAAVV